MRVKKTKTVENEVLVCDWCKKEAMPYGLPIMPCIGCGRDVCKACGVTVDFGDQWFRGCPDCKNTIIEYGALAQDAQDEADKKIEAFIKECKEKCRVNGS